MITGLIRDIGVAQEEVRTLVGVAIRLDRATLLVEIDPCDLQQIDITRPLTITQTPQEES